MATHIGDIKELWRYPIKSLLGEAKSSLEFDERGAHKDREYAICNEEGKLGSGKNTTRFVRIDGLFDLSAALNDSGEIIVSDAEGLIHSDNADIGQSLSMKLGQSVTLAKQNAIDHFDDSPVHILTTGNLRQLQRLVPESKIDARRFRPNIVIDSEIADRELIGKGLKIGELKLSVTHATERCRMITLEQQELEDNPRILKAIAQNFDLSLGVYAKVAAKGRVAIGDVVSIC